MAAEPTAQLFEYELGHAGWATAKIHLEDKTIELEVSYMHDSLRELARAILALDRDPREISVCFIEEPSTHQLVLKRTDDEILDVAIFRYKDWVVRWPPASGQPGELRARGIVRWRTFRGCVTSVLQRLWREHGPEEYLARWQAHPFPLDELRALENSGG